MQSLKKHNLLTPNHESSPQFGGTLPCHNRIFGISDSVMAELFLMSGMDWLNFNYTLQS